jgi:REP element-mobilizing transposase RayT
MPRLARLDAPGVLHHLMIRGIERRKIFWNDEDREDFLDRLSRVLSETHTACYAWVLIPNHAHFLFKGGQVPLATVMRRLHALSFILSSGKQQRKVKARGLLCFWAVRELGISLTDLAKLLKLSVPGVGYSVERGESVARENGYQLVERLSQNLKGIPTSPRISM